MSEFIEKNGALFLAAVIFVSFFASLSMAPLFDLDEGAFSEATREMLASGNYLTTYLNGVLRFDKPILIYWFQALSASIFGIKAFAFRLPSALAGIGWAYGIYWFGRRYFDRLTAFMAAFFMVVSLQTTIIAKAAIADSLLNMFIAYSMFFLFIFLDKNQKKYLYLSFGAIALGFMTKGPVALLIPIAVSFIYLLTRRDLGRFFKMVFNPLGILIFVLIASPWYILEYREQGMAFINGFFLKHNLSRFNTSFEGHSGSLFYYIPVVILGLLPFSSPLFKAVGAIRSWFRDDLSCFLASWFLFVFLFFSFSGTKLPHYVIYGYTPLFFMMARTLKEVKSGFLFFMPTILLFVILLILPEAALSLTDIINDDFAKALIPAVQDCFTISYRIFFLMAIAGLLFLSFTKRYGVITKTVLLGLIMVVAVNFVVIPTYGKIAQEPIQEAARIAKREGLQVVFFGIDAPSFSVASGQIVPERQPVPGDVVLTKVTKLKYIMSYDTIYEKNGIVLVKVKK